MCLTKDSNVLSKYAFARAWKRTSLAVVQSTIFPKILPAWHMFLMLLRRELTPFCSHICGLYSVPYSPEILRNKSVILHQEVAESFALSLSILSLSLSLTLSVLIRMRARNVNPALILSGLIGRIVDNPGITEFQQKNIVLVRVRGLVCGAPRIDYAKMGGTRRWGGRMVYCMYIDEYTRARACLYLRLHLVAREVEDGREG